MALVVTEIRFFLLFTENGIQAFIYFEYVHFSIHGYVHVSLWVSGQPIISRFLEEGGGEHNYFIITLKLQGFYIGLSYPRNQRLYLKTD